MSPTDQADPPPTLVDSSPFSEALLDRLATDVLAPLWRGIDPDYKGKYARNIWQQFEDNVRSAAYTSRLAHFVQRLTTRLGIAVRSDDVARLAGAVRELDDRAALKALREEATYLVLLVRVANEERKTPYRREA